MFLKSLEIRGFKSFPDKTILSFGEGITAVVGPNGSGKSNISDAIRWVLGEQSNKTLRSTKMEDVIFNGTATRKPLGFAEVSLTIDNRDRELAFDSDEVCVSRRYYRSGESEYILNNTTVRLKDVQMLFMDTGLGRDGYSVIGQGRIADIVASRSDNRREIFEEAAGISKYRYRKNEAERRLQNTEDNLVRLRDIMAELESRVGPLETQAKKAEKFLSYADEKKSLEIGLWLYDISRSRDVMRSLSDKLELARTQYDTAETSIDEIERKIEEIGEEMLSFSVQIDELHRSAISFDEQAAHVESDIAVYKNDITHLEEDIKRIETDRDQHNSDDQQLQDEIARCQEEITKREALIAEADQERLALSEQLDAISQSSDEASTQMQDQNQIATDIAKELAEVRVLEITGNSTLAEIAIQIEQLESSVESLRAAAEEAEQEKTESTAAYEACQNNIESLQNTVNGYEMRYNARMEKAEKAKHEAEQAHLDAEETKRRLHILEDLERTMEGFAGSTKLIMKQAERGVMPGIHGAVSRLMEVPTELALAIETALGNAAQNVICNTVKDAKRGIQFLKNENAGRVTFLPIDTIKDNPLKETDVTKEPGVRGIASDLISYDSKFAAIMSSLLGRTVIADDMDTATEIAKKYQYRFRVVTLDGQVVNAGGSLTGGSHVKGAGLLSRRSEMEVLQEQQRKAEEKAEAANNTYLDLQEEASAAKAALIGAQGELTTAQEDGIRLESDFRRITELAENRAEALENCLADIEALNKRTTEITAIITEAKAKIEKLTQRQEAVNDILEKLSGGRAEMSTVRDSLSTQMAEIKLRSVGYEKEIDGIRATIDGIEKRRLNDDDYREQLNAQIDGIQNRIGEIRESIEKLTAEAEGYRKDAQSARDTADLMVQKKNENDTEVSSLRQKSRSLSDEKERLGGEVARLEEKSTHAEEETDNILRKLYEEYELTRAEAEEIATVPEDIPESRRRLNELKNKIRGLGSVNVGAIEEYKEVKERYDFMSVQIADVEISKKELLELIEDLTTQMREMFILRFNQINTYFQETFVDLFDGGKAILKLENPDDILHSGIELNAQPPGKVILNIDALSGGEKSLTAIALLFAILRVTPSPFCMLDEIDAALDDTNIARFVSYLRRLTDKTQFIAITHRRGTMEESDVLYGVTMQEKGVTKLLELRASEVEARLGIRPDEVQA